MSFERAAHPAAEAKKAEGASWTALRIPNPPSDTGREAWSQADSLTRFTFRTSLVIERWMLSNSIKLWDLKHGEVLSKNRIYGWRRHDGGVKEHHAS
jgi:hypothetical protein